MNVEAYTYYMRMFVGGAGMRRGPLRRLWQRNAVTRPVPDDSADGRQPAWTVPQMRGNRELRVNCVATAGCL